MGCALPARKGLPKVDRSPPCWPIFCWMTWTRNWNAADIASAVTLTTVTSTFGRWPPGSGSAVAKVGERKFLGHRLLLNGKLGISPKSIARAKERIRQITSRTRGCSLAQVIVALNLFIIGWVAYYRFAACGFDLQCLDEWIRRRLRCFRLKQRKRSSSVARFLRRLGVSPLQARKLAGSGKGPWRLANTRPCKAAMSVKWFQQLRSRSHGPPI